MTAGVRLPTGGGDEEVVSISSVAGCGEDRFRFRKARMNESPIQQSTGFSLESSTISPVRAGWLYKLPVLSNIPF